MKLKDFYKRLESKDFFRNFKKENPDSFLISVFCSISKNEKESDKIIFNFYSPKKKKIFSSEYPFDDVREVEEKELNEKELFLDNLNLDTDNLWENIEKISKNKIPVKAICFLISEEWKIRIFFNDLSLKKVNINHAGEITKKEDMGLKDSFLNFN